jgi:hypothetical protein
LLTGRPVLYSVENGIYSLRSKLFQENSSLQEETG